MTRCLWIGGVLLIAGLGLPGAASAQQDTAKCASITVSRATEADMPALVADAECFSKALVSAANSQALRLAKARELTAVAGEVPPDDPHAGHAMPPMPDFKPLTVANLTPIDTDIAVRALVKPTAIPASAQPDVVGAFRLTCNVSHFSYDDPIAYPGQPGASHLHMFFGNETVDAHSTYESLRAAGEGTCQGKELNRSGYWTPALLDAAGSMVVPDWIVLYYKRAPMGSPFCARPYAERCEGIPPGLHAIFGNNYIHGELESDHATFDCEGETKTTSLARTAAMCRNADFIYARISAPDCWDGVNLDSADHQAHLAYQARNVNSGRYLCPKTHPVLIPTLTQTIAYAVLPGDDPTQWIFSSDVMAGAEAGTTFHADYIEAWEPSVRLTWEGHCIDGLLNCSDGNLGDGTVLPRPAGFTFAQRPHLMPAPARPARRALVVSAQEASGASDTK